MMRFLLPQCVAARSNSRSGFTLIEVLVAVTVFAGLLIIIARAFLTTITTSDRLTTAAKVKQEGDLVLTQLSTAIRNAQRVTGCTANTVTVMDRTNTPITYGAEVAGGITRMYANSGNYITADGTSVTAGPTFGCEQDANGQFKLVRITFTLSRTDPTSASQDFSTVVGLRKY